MAFVRGLCHLHKQNVLFQLVVIFCIIKYPNTLRRKNMHMGFPAFVLCFCLIISTLRLMRYCINVALLNLPYNF